MKNALGVALLLTLMAGCTTRTAAGPCIGVLDKEKPGVAYELSYWNLFLGAFFSETLVVPAVVVLKDVECPVEAP